MNRMKKNSFIIPIIILLICSCSLSKKGKYIKDIPTFQNIDNSKNLYVVDTINIKNPILIESKEGHPFIMPDKALDRLEIKKEFWYILI